MATHPTVPTPSPATPPQSIDADNSGTITAEELRNALKNKGSLLKPEVGAMFLCWGGWLRCSQQVVSGAQLGECAQFSPLAQARRATHRTLARQPQPQRPRAAGCGRPQTRPQPQNRLLLAALI